MFATKQIFAILLLAASACAYGPKYSNWSAWSVPDVSCGFEQQTVIRTRTCLNDRCASRDLRESKRISLPPCPINGGWSQWSAWTQPDETCGGMTVQVFQTRECNNPFPENGGLPCSGSSQNVRTITLPDCPTPAPIINGEWSDWSAWSRISKTCCAMGSNETIYRTRTCDNPPPSDDGSPCIGADRETRIVQIPKCPVNGGFGEWSQWTQPSVSCSDQVVFVFRHRDCNRPAPSNGGLPCQGDSDQTQIFPLDPCPTPAPIIDGQWSSWSEWSRVSKTCCTNGGTTTETIFRTRTCDNPPPSDGGSPCVGADRETKVVQIPKCQTYGTTRSYGAVVKTDGVWSSWSEWSEVMQTCSETGFVTVTRTRTCLYPSNGAMRGLDCVGEAMQTKVVSVPSCIVIGEWSEWSSWSVPTVSCSANGRATVERTRICLFASLGGGGGDQVPCPGEAIERKTVNVPMCAKYEQKAPSKYAGSAGVWGPWSEWSEPAATCVREGETVSVSRTRQCVYASGTSNGRSCVGVDREEKIASLPPCETTTPSNIADPTWSQWSQWSQPQVTCSDTGTVQVTRTRFCIVDPQATDEEACEGEDVEYKTLSIKICQASYKPAYQGSSYQPTASDGVWGAWSSWSNPQVTCYTTSPPQVMRTRTCVYNPKRPQGNQCQGASMETKDADIPMCITPAPIVDGVWSEWSEWSVAMETCNQLGFVTVQRTRTCGTPNGEEVEFNPCPGSDMETKRVSVPSCSVHGMWGPWTAFSTPTITCDESRQTIVTRTRRCIFPSNAGDNLVACVGLAMEGKLVILPRCFAAIEAPYAPPSYNKSPYQSKTTPSNIEISSGYQGYRAPYQAKTTPAPIEDTTAYQAYRSKNTPAPIEDTTAYQSYRSKNTPSNIESPTVYQGYRPPYQAKTTPAPIIETTGYDSTGSYEEEYQY